MLPLTNFIHQIHSEGIDINAIIDKKRAVTLNVRAKNTVTDSPASVQRSNGVPHVSGSPNENMGIPSIVPV